MPLPVKREESSRLVVEVHMLSVAMDMVGKKDQPQTSKYWANY